MERDACARVIRLGDGWMTCCRAKHPEELTEQITALRKAAADLGEDFGRYTVAYQVTMNIGDSAEQAAHARSATTSPATTPSSAGRWTCPTGDRRAPRRPSRTGSGEFSAAGVRHFICRFGAIDQFGQVERFAREVLPPSTWPALERKVDDDRRTPHRGADARLAELVVDVCFAVKDGDVVTIITDDRRKPEAEIVATVVAERGAWPIMANNEMQVRRARADTLFPMAPPRNLHQAMVTSDEIIIITNLEWANRFAHVPAVKESWRTTPASGRSRRASGAGRYRSPTSSRPSATRGTRWPRSRA